MTASGPVLDIDLDALAANFRFFADLADRARPGARSAAVVKCDAYGLGAAQALAPLVEAGAEDFFVAYAGEALGLRAAADAAGLAPRLYALLGPLTAEDARDLIAARAIPVLNTPRQARLWRDAAEASGAPQPCALHVETGLHRLALAPEAYRALLADAAFRKAAPVAIVMSHLACGFDENSPRNGEQIAAFAELARLAPEAETSLAASAGVMLDPPAACDLARIGVGLYGVGPQDRPEPRLQPVARLSSPVLQIADLQAGDPVGYGGEYVAPGPVRIATLAIGYGDGVPRRLAGRWSVVIKGVAAPMVGRVSMDLVTVDASAVPELAPGDMAEVFGPAASIDALADAADTIGYEILTGLGARPRRRYWKKGAPVAS